MKIFPIRDKLQKIVYWINHKVRTETQLADLNNKFNSNTKQLNNSKNSLFSILQMNLYKPSKNTKILCKLFFHQSTFFDSKTLIEWKQTWMLTKSQKDGLRPNIVEQAFVNLYWFRRYHRSFLDMELRKRSINHKLLARTLKYFQG